MGRQRPGINDAGARLQVPGEPARLHGQEPWPRRVLRQLMALPVPAHTDHGVQRYLPGTRHVDGCTESARTEDGLAEGLDQCAVQLQGEHTWMRLLPERSDDDLSW